MFCPNCGKKISKNSNICQNCGSELFEKPIKEVSQSENLSSTSRRISTGTSTNTASIVKIVFGIIFFIAGLVSLLSRGELTVKIVGRGQIMQEAFFGGSSMSDTLTAIIVISAIVMIIGLALSIWGFIQIQKKN